ncbi:hypothetical protein ScalyP_jg8250 [Parmales sp. scaly parma]|nr:hypothetical protein ScalyP_jg8250 [Parmales sp. scaly parma]
MHLSSLAMVFMLLILLSFLPAHPFSTINPSRPSQAVYPKVGDIITFTDTSFPPPSSSSSSSSSSTTTLCDFNVAKITQIYKTLGQYNAYILPLEPLTYDQFSSTSTSDSSLPSGTFFREPSYTKRRKTTTINLSTSRVFRINASFVRPLDSYKIPVSSGNPPELVKTTTYDLETYGGPEVVGVDQDVVREDLENYKQLKTTGFVDSCIVSILGIAGVASYDSDLITPFSIGAVGGLMYLYLLSVETDSVGAVAVAVAAVDKKWTWTKLRFLTPLFLLLPQALSNILFTHQATGIFDTVTRTQFLTTFLGFSAWRLPFLVRNVGPVIGESILEAGLIPGSAGIVAKTVFGKAEELEVGTTEVDIGGGGGGGVAFERTVLMVSGPTGGGKTRIVNEFLKRVEGEGRFKRGSEEGGEGVIDVIDASVDEAEKLRIGMGSSTRIIGVWVGLDSLEKVEDRLRVQYEEREGEGKREREREREREGEREGEGSQTIGDSRSKSNEEAREKFVKEKIPQIIREIEFGVTSGMFEFTILNDDIDKSVEELVKASGYCFK